MRLAPCRRADRAATVARMDVTRCTPVELIAALPRMLGRYPHERLVAVALDGAGGVVVCMEIAREQCLRFPEAARDIAAQLMRYGGDTAVLVSFTDDAVRLACPAIDAVAAQLGGSLRLVAAFVVQRGRYFVPGCCDDCCPVEGNPLPAWADFGEGQEIHGIEDEVDEREWADRDESYEEGWGMTCEEIECELGAAAWRRNWRGTASDCERAARTWDRALVRKTAMTPRTAGRLGAALDDLRVRDYVVLRLLDAPDEACAAALGGRSDDAVGRALQAVFNGTVRPDPVSWERRARVLDQTAGLTTGPERAHLHTLLAILAWWAKDGERAAAVAASALLGDRNYRLAELVHIAASRGILPGAPRKRDKSS